jgi:hypothetical protein
MTKTTQWQNCNYLKMYFGLTEIKLRFQMDITQYGSSLWTTGSILKISRDSLTKTPAEPVSLNLGRWI